jgi:exopolysaccharide production protein ExoZ
LNGTQPTAGRDLFGIQILRGIAALGVVVHHTLEESYRAAAGFRSPDWLTTAGAAGVDIFFVISGFIMLHVSFSSTGKAIKPGSFLLRRIGRIYPLYWIFCAATLALSGLGFFASKVLTTTVIAKSLLLVPTPETLIDASWTLSFEMYFYLVFAATLRFGSKNLSMIISIAVIVTLVVTARTVFGGEVGEFLANPISIEFCFGLLVAGFWQANLSNTTGIAVGLVGMIIIVTAPLYVPHASTNALPEFARVIVWGLPAALILAAFASLGTPRGAALWCAGLIGDASYSIYLSHGFVMAAYAKMLKSTVVGSHSQLAVIPIVIGICVAVGLIAHFVAERPLVKLMRRLLQDKKGVHPQTKVQIS